MFVRIVTDTGRELEFEDAELVAGLELVEVHQGDAVVFCERRELVAYWSAVEVPQPKKRSSSTTCAGLKQTRRSL